MNVLTAMIERESMCVSRRRIVVVAALVLLAGVIVTCAMHTPISSMSELPMPGGSMLLPAFAPMCGRTWLRAAAGFVGMWIATMLPSFEVSNYKRDKRRTTACAPNTHTMPITPPASTCVSRSNASAADWFASMIASATNTHRKKYPTT